MQENKEAKEEEKNPVWNDYVKFSLVLLLSIVLILFTQWVKLLKNPASTPITLSSIEGLFVLWAFSMLGIVISRVVEKTKIKILMSFPILGWVSLVSLIFCLISNFFVKAITSVDFLSITTPILAFAGISVADSLVDLRKASWKIAIVAVFVFIGMYIGSALLAQIGLNLSGK